MNFTRRKRLKRELRWTPRNFNSPNYKLRLIATDICRKSVIQRRVIAISEKGERNKHRISVVVKVPAQQ